MNSDALSAADVEAINDRLEKANPPEICRWATQTFSDRLVMTSSFGADSMCTVHLAAQVKPDIRIIVLNTGYLFPETLAFMEEMRQLYHLNVLEYRTRNDPVTWLTINGEPDPRVRRNRKACCAANKDEVMDRAMREIAPLAYLRGVRADQTEERAKMKIIQWSDRYNCWAISPILQWSSRDVFNYMKQNGLPHNPLWERGYTSIGCNPETCTRPVGAEENERAGRWAGSDKKECGIHLELGKDI